MLPPRWLIPLAFLAWTAGCSMGDTTAGRGEAQKAVDAFHAQLNEGHFGDIYDGASEEFRNAAGRKRFLEVLEAVERKLGKVTETHNEGWRVNSRNFQTYVELAQRTRFERGEAQESFVFAVRTGKASLLRYNINSDDLIIR